MRSAAVPLLAVLALAGGCGPRVHPRADEAPAADVATAIAALPDAVHVVIGPVGTLTEVGGDVPDWVAIGFHRREARIIAGIDVFHEPLAVDHLALVVRHPRWMRWCDVDVVVIAISGTRAEPVPRGIAGPETAAATDATTVVLPWTTANEAAIREALARVRPIRGDRLAGRR